MRWLAGMALAAALAHAGAAAGDPAGKDAKALSEQFWTDWSAYKGGDTFKTLNEKAGCVDAANAAIGKGRQTGAQAIADIAIEKPEEAAKLLEGAGAAKRDAAAQGALETVLALRATPLVRTQAEALAAPSGGIAGLPGVHLSGEPITGTARAAAPAGYAPVFGGSRGCPGG